MKNPFLISLYFILLVFPLSAEEQDLGNMHILEKYIESSAKSTPPNSDDYELVGIDGVTKKNVKQVNRELTEFILGKKDFNTIGLYYGRHYPSYRYDTTQDYSYQFNDTHANIIPVTIQNTQLELPVSEYSDKLSVFLKINVHSDSIGRFFPPTLIVRDGNATSTHTFERGASGIRYINLSNLQMRNKKRLSLEGMHLSIPDQEAELILYQNDVLDNKTILVIATHPDDAEIAAFGLYSKYHTNSYIVTLTAGDAGPDTIYRNFYSDRKQRYLEKGKERTWDSLTIPALGRVSYGHSLNLGFFDGRLPIMYQHKDQNYPGLYIDTSDIQTFRKENHSPLAKLLEGSANWNSLVDNLASLILRIKPDIIVTPYSRIDRHPDHKYTTAALFEAIQKSGIKSGKLFLYTNHPVNSEYFPFGKRWESVDLPPNFTPLYFDGIYSHTLSEKKQREKLFALEAISDLRFEAIGNPFDDPCKNENPLTCRDFSYFRRAVRSNELFFIVDIKNIYKRNILEAILN